MVVIQTGKQKLKIVFVAKLGAMNILLMQKQPRIV